MRMSGRERRSGRTPLLGPVAGLEKIAGSILTSHFMQEYALGIAWRFMRERCWARTVLDLRSMASATGNFRKRVLWRLAMMSRSGRTLQLTEAHWMTRGLERE